MNLFRITLKQRSPFGTEPTSDLILGHLAWAYRYRQGAAALTALLNHYRDAGYNGSAPPLICSAALPWGMLPRPQFDYLLRADHDALAVQRHGTSETAARLLLDQELAAARHQPWIATATLETLVNGLDAVGLYRALLAHRDQLAAQAQPVGSAPNSQPTTPFLSGAGEPRGEALTPTLNRHRRTQPSMSRLTGGVQEGLLYDSEGLYYTPRQELVIWVRIAPAFADDAWLAIWRDCFALLAEQGIGARNSTGMGAVQLLENLTAVGDDALPAAANPNGFISLSSWVPQQGDPDAIAYKLDTRHGRLGGLYGAGDDVWKYPVTTLLPGAVGKLVAGEALRLWYGGLVSGVHRTRAEIVNFGYAFPIGVSLL